MPSSPKRASFLLPLLLLSLPFSSSQEDLSLPPDSPHLRRLESLIDSLARSVAALESSLASCSSPCPSSAPDLHSSPAPDGAAAVSVTKHRTLWSERFHFAAAARLDAPPTAVSVLPYDDLDGSSKYFAVGDTRGRVYIFSAAGDVVVELPSVSDSPVTSMLSYLTLRRNESFLFTGHADGSIAAHRLWESAANGDDWLTLFVGSSKPFVRGSKELDSPPVSGLEVHQVGRVRYIVATDGGGRIRVFTENGTLYGTAIASRQPLAFVKQRLLFLTETGAGSLDLRTMVIKETECEGLNGSVVKAYSFDLSERSKAYGFTASGDLVYVVLLGDVGNLKCRARAVRKAEIEAPVAIQTIKGYLLVSSYDKVSVYNISSQFYGRVMAPRLLFSATINEIRSSFLNHYASSDGSHDGKPLIAADREKLVILGLGDGYIGIYKSSFPAFKMENNAVIWSGPALLFLLFLIAIWQFYVKKKDSLGWMPDESFGASSAASGSILASGATDRGYVDEDRTGDPRELRGGMLRGPTRRYVSPPSRYPGGSGVGFRSGSAEPSIRGVAGVGDLKFRGQHIDPANFTKRREPLFPNSQAGDDHTD